MRRITRFFLFLTLSLSAYAACGEILSGISDIPTRPGVTLRVSVIAPPEPRAAVLLFAGGHGGLQLAADGTIGWGKNNFLVRSRQLFSDQGLLTLVVDAPSDRQSPPFLTDFRQTKEHLSDIKALIAWVRAQQPNIPVWLIGTSRGTQSVAYIATELSLPEGPDGIVLTSSILSDKRMRAVPELPLDKVSIPVLVVHHELDGCNHCAYSNIPSLMEKLDRSPKKSLLSFQGGLSQGNPCEAKAYHGYNGIEASVVTQISAWILGTRAE